ncbi:hypothetical protein AUJ14_06280 [Candidatus Micrarchaeota archaeon CG1_02_55_22]|nr:MAG: hypothetical protein AUJ14_06280 [Candidatus Micrarchaeota archaeon CG1_02_55_22]
MNVRFTGAVEQILDEAVKRGYAATKTDALRLGVLELNNRYKLLEAAEDYEDILRADEIMGRVAAGKEKLLSEADLMKKLE